MKVLLAISAALNVALAAWLLAGRAEPAQSVTASVPTAPGANTGAPVRLDAPAGDDAAKILKVAGIAAKVESTGANEYWVAKPMRDARLRIARYDALEASRASLRAEFGDTAVSDLAFAAIFQPNARRWSYLSAESQRALEKILIEDLRTRAASPEFLGRPRVSPDVDRAIRAALNPSEYFEYSLRESALAEQLLATGFDFSEKEFRDVYAAWEKGSAQLTAGRQQAMSPMLTGLSSDDPRLDQLRGALGEERLEKFLKVQDPVFKMIQAAAHLYPASPQKLDQAYLVVRDTQRKAGELLLDSGPVIGAKTRQGLEKLKLDRSRKLASILGEPAAELLDRSMGPLDSLDVGVGLVPVVAR
jgi:hypothetical protein